jgi:hypothetical protein
VIPQVVGEDRGKAGILGDEEQVVLTLLGFLKEDATHLRGSRPPTATVLPRFEDGVERKGNREDNR